MAGAAIVIHPIAKTDGRKKVRSCFVSGWLSALDLFVSLSIGILLAKPLGPLNHLWPTLLRQTEHKRVTHVSMDRNAPGNAASGLRSEVHFPTYV